MPKLKTKKTLAKRVKVTKTGKIVKKQSRTGHLKEKWTAGRKSRKTKRVKQKNKGHKKIFKKMLGKKAKGV
jgi:large subunit ribosomal protein L35